MYDLCSFFAVHINMSIYLSTNLNKTDSGLGRQASAARVRLYLKQMNVAEISQRVGASVCVQALSHYVIILTSSQTLLSTLISDPDHSSVS